MAVTSEDSSTTHSKLASRRGSRQIAHGSSSVSVPHSPQAVTRARTAGIPSDGGGGVPPRLFNRKHVTLCPLPPPTPGRLPLPPPSSSSAHTGVYRGTLTRGEHPSK